jgi:hypothetical protein
LHEAEENDRDWQKLLGQGMKKMALMDATGNLDGWNLERNWGRH